MASLHKFTNSNITPNYQMIGSSPVPVNKLEQRLHSDVTPTQKWAYLLANHIRFINKPTHSIRINKPKQSELANWLEKIITNGQCNLLFVEELQLDEVSFKRLKQQCIDHQVTLVNLTLNDTAKSNVIQGPW